MGQAKARKQAMGNGYGKPAPPPELNHTGTSDVIVIGHQVSDDQMSLLVALSWLKKNRGNNAWDRFAGEMDFDSYNMGKYPERGDALDHITEQTKLVVALHLNGLHHPIAREVKTPDFLEEMEEMTQADGLPKGYRYDRDNYTLLGRCLAVGASLICVGEQPRTYVRDPHTRTQINGQDPAMGGSDIWLYEPVMVNA